MDSTRRVEVCKREASIQFERALWAESELDFNYYFKLGMQWLRAAKAEQRAKLEK